MKTVGLIFLFIIIIGCQQPAGNKPITLDTDINKASYSIGIDVGKSFTQQEFDLNSDCLAQGIRDGLAGTDPLMTTEEMEETLKKFQEDLMNKQNTSRKGDSEINVREGEEFLAANKEKEGVITTESGLQYKVITPGTGRTPKATDTVETHYRGTLINGKEFDSSYKRNQTTSFPVNGVIKGWTEALLLMKEGAKWQLFIPSDLAYGARGAGGDIGPNATLIFDIELIAVK